MSVPDRSHSYPYMSIAGWYGVPYALVLMSSDVLDYKTTNRDVNQAALIALSKVCGSAVHSIVAENKHQSRIRNGEVKFDAQP